ncbi:formate dehydrogenase subunit gamma [Oceaniglobus indicus]|uniref:formate dehydrogenase subunit gamma n=1 Tax=Oceaniglobus indicus TaxID=2047749 RepID=UPI00188287B9|nr:formate dehydrogenase subunit gamma [Oceaniglobus indicus]
MLRIVGFMQVMCLLLFASLAQAQNVRPPGADAPLDIRAGTGGAQTLQDILARQKGLTINNDFRKTPTDLPSPDVGALGTRGGASDADLWRGVRFDTVDMRTQVNGPATDVLVQDTGMWWLEVRRGPLPRYGLYLLGGTLAVLALFFLIRGRIRIEGPITGRTLLRFTGIERFAHWLLAASFILLGLTGLFSLFGRKVLIPTFGHDSFASAAAVTKWLHDSVSWAFMLALILIFVFWVIHNLPDRTDLNWLAKGGGLVGSAHPPAKKFNAGQKLIFWSVVIFGTSISVSGLSLLFPFELHLFAPTFALLNDWGVAGWFGQAPFPADLTPQEEMAYAQLWHAILAFVLTAIIFGHIYIGTLGMEGAFDAMGSGEVEEEWAREHHSIWAAEEIARRDAPAAPRHTNAPVLPKGA